MARPLARFLEPPGSYEGFDIVPSGVAWCQQHYRDYPRFRFQVAEVTNGMYRPHGGVPASEYRFPYDDDSFDFAFATSVFTHLLPPEAERYLAEMVRVTRPGGRILATFFLLGSQTAEPGQRPGDRLTFPHDRGDHAVDSQETPEAAVAYRDRWLRERSAAHGLTPEVHHGTWSGRDDGLSLQDIVILRLAQSS
jgi:SAM-dependent methyltransferase